MRTPEQYDGVDPLTLIPAREGMLGIYMADNGRTLRIVYAYAFDSQVSLEIPAIDAYPLGKALISLGDEGGVV